MAAYAALVSLFNNLDAINNHPRFSTSFDNHKIHVLGSHVDFLHKFVEANNIDGDTTQRAKNLRIEIVSAAHEAEDIIESHILDVIRPQSAETSDPPLHGRLEKVIQDMHSIIKVKVMEFQRDAGPASIMPASSSTSPQVDFMLPSSSSAHPPADSTSSSTPQAAEKDAMVGLDEELNQLRHVLIMHKTHLQIILIGGMGGAGKTTLANHVYQDSLITHHFEVYAFAIVSQDYNATKVLQQLLSVKKGNFNELGEKLHKKLFSRRYLIVLDDVWSDEVWKDIKCFFPDDKNGSRVVITSRLLNLGTDMCVKVNSLKKKKGWRLFCQKIFGEEKCPAELMRIGKWIVKKCNGLPLSIVVIGGILRKLPRTQKYWWIVAHNINEIVRENGEYSNLLYLSYSHLPAYLKPCFLYVGIFAEDSIIRVSEVIRLWIAEGFLKPNGVQVLEETAEDYLKDLVDRNIIIVCARGSMGKIKTFRIHDLLRELCISVGNKEAFFSTEGKHRICVACVPIHAFLDDIRSQSRVLRDFQPELDVRSLILIRSVVDGERFEFRGRLLRVINMGYPDLDIIDDYDPDCRILSDHMNLRYISWPCKSLSSSISLMWNLQTLVLWNEVIVAPVEIWEMIQLRHLKGMIKFANPPASEDKDESVVMRNLQTIVYMENFTLSAEVCKRIPNIKKLNISIEVCGFAHVLENLRCLQRLESLRIYCFLKRDEYRDDFSELMHALPSSLKKLSLGGQRNMKVSFEAVSKGVGLLPHLEVLKLDRVYHDLQKWSCLKQRYLRLKYLRISCCDLEEWSLEEKSCFPLLEKLVLTRLHKLKELPSCLAKISTLQFIDLEQCNESLIISAIKIKKEHFSTFGNPDFQIQVKMWKREEKMELKEKAKKERLSLKNVHLQTAEEDGLEREMEGVKVVKFQMVNNALVRWG